MILDDLKSDNFPVGSGLEEFREGFAFWRLGQLGSARDGDGVNQRMPVCGCVFFLNGD